MREKLQKLLNECKISYLLTTNNIEFRKFIASGRDGTGLHFS